MKRKKENKGLEGKVRGGTKRSPAVTIQDNGRYTVIVYSKDYREGNIGDPTSLSAYYSRDNPNSPWNLNHQGNFREPFNGG